MPESSDSQFFTACTGIQLGPFPFGKSRMIMNFLTNLLVTWILFTLVLQGKERKKIPESTRLDFLEDISANNAALSDSESNTSGSLNWVSIVDLFLNVGLFCFISMSKFDTLPFLFHLVLK